MGGVGWEIFFYVIIIFSSILAVILLPFSFLSGKVRYFINFLALSYWIGCIGHLGMAGRIISMAVEKGRLKFDSFLAWTVFGVLYFIIGFILIIMDMKGAGVSAPKKIYFLFLIGIIPSVVLLYFSR
ncbi:hypothetical protein [Xanthomonas vasicola]|uniref:Uncharacterized protein n=2 Tax=Xanthomonas vasicola TaxID=56459 RepID=A0ABD7S3K9_XANVA|nr:hypothetical protein [Xanthomonas vasicola]TWQ48574.1 hypothetical protein FQK01_23435 [Xanthomonas vasicola]